MPEFIVIIFMLLMFVMIIIMSMEIKSIKETLRSPDMMPMLLSVESRDKDLNLVDVYLNNSFLKILQEYLSKDLEFSESSPVKKYISGKYCDLIQYLLRPDITFNFKFDDGTRKSKKDNSKILFWLHNRYLFSKTKA